MDSNNQEQSDDCTQGSQNAVKEKSDGQVLRHSSRTVVSNKQENKKKDSRKVMSNKQVNKKKDSKWLRSRRK